MDSITYINNAIRTESVPKEIVIDQLALHAVLTIAVDASAVVDQAKRKIFYGKDFDREKMLQSLGRLYNLVEFLGQAVEGGVDIGSPQDMTELATGLEDAHPDVHNIDLANINVRLMHAALGMFTESGELVELIKDQYEGKPFDKVGFGEEVGDVEWYQAIGFDETGVTEASCREKNIAKLRKRYPEKFDAGQAVNRDLAAERKILEEAVATAVVTAPAAALKEVPESGIVTKGGE